MKNKSFFEYFMSEWAMILGGMSIGLSLPIGMNIIENPVTQFAIFFPIGLIILAASYYYKFEKK